MQLFNRLVNKSILVFVCFFFSMSALSAQETVDIDIRVNSPLSGSLEQFADRTLFTITTNFVEPREVALLIEINGLNGEAENFRADNQISSLSSPVTLQPGLNVFNWVTLSNQFGEGYSIDDITINGSDVQRRLVMEQRIFPSGDYQICMRAIDPLTTLEYPTSMPGNNCEMFSIRFYNPPRITIPNDPGQIVSVQVNEDNNVYFHWNVATFVNTDFTLIIRRFANFEQATRFIGDGRPQDVFDGLDLVGQIETNRREYNTIEGDIIIEEGVFYTCQIVARSDGANFLNGGRSNSPVWTLGSSASRGCLSPNYQANIVFPVSNDTIPFLRIPQMVQMQPICDELLKVKTELLTASAGVSAYVSTKERNWTNSAGPYNFLRTHLERNVPGRIDYWLPNREVAGYLLLDDLTDSPYVYTRGATYKSTATLSTEHRIPTTGTINSERIQLTDLSTAGFTVGMPTPVLRFPENRITSSTGNVEFTFNTGENPRKPLPTYKLLSISGNSAVMSNMHVYEKCVFQIATSDQFNQGDIVFSKLKKIQVEGNNIGNNYDPDNPNLEAWQRGNDYFTNREYDYRGFMEKVYRDFNVTVPLSDEGTYYWRVVWLKDPSAVNVSEPHASIDITDEMIYHKSNTRIINIGAGDDDGMHEELCTVTDDLPDDDVEDEESECVSSAIPPTITNRDEKEDILVGDAVSIGMFSLELTEVNLNSDKTYSGKGLIAFDFLNNTKVEVRLNNVKINQSKQIFGGTITPILDQEFELEESVTSSGRSIGMSQDEAELLSSSLHAGGKLLSVLSGGQQVNLPLGIDKEMGGKEFTIAILDFEITHDQPATLKAVFNTDLDFLETPNSFLSFGAELQFHPEGLASEGKMYKMTDLEIPLSNGNYFIVNGSEGESDPEKSFYVQWDCNGFKCMNIAAKMKFSREVLVPDTEDGTPGAGNVEFDLQSKICSESNFIFGIDAPAFQIPSAEGWGFSPAEDLYVDLSDIENVPGFQSNLPEGYEHSSFEHGDGATAEEKEEQSNTWKGFYMGGLNIKAPKDFITEEGNRLSFGVDNLIIDETGVSLKFLVEDVLDINSGQLDDCKFSIDSIFMNIVQSSFADAGFNGEFGIPYTEKNEYLKYKAVFEHEDEENNFLFTVKPQDDFSIPLMMATANVKPTTYIEISLGDDTYLEVNLDANISMSDSNLAADKKENVKSTVSLPSIDINNLLYNSNTGFKNTDAFHYTVASPQKSMGGFPISLNAFNISIGKEPTIYLEPQLVLMSGEDGFSATAGIDIVTSFESGNISLSGIDLRKVGIDVETSGLKLDGEVEFYDDDGAEGVRGDVTLEFDMGQKIGAKINADFGTYKNPGLDAPLYNTEDWYSYFNVDGMLYTSSGITLFSGLSLYGLGGGFYKNMRLDSGLPAGNALVANDGAGKDRTGGKSSVKYKPQFGSIGMKFMTILGSNGDQGESYNIDVALNAEFSAAGGLTELGLKGSFRVMDGEIAADKIQNTDSAPVAGYMRMTYHNPEEGEESFDGVFLVKVNVAGGLLKGIGGDLPFPTVEGSTATTEEANMSTENAMIWASFYVGPDKWFYHMGTPDNRGGLKLSIPGTETSLITLTSYLMLGHDIPDVLPEPSAEFMRIFNSGNPEQKFDSTDGAIDGLMAGQPRIVPTPGKGFAFGASLAVNIDARAMPFYAKFAMAMGFDINVTQDDDRVCAESGRNPGVNKWYGQGQFYAGIEGDIGLYVDLWFIEGEFSILKAMAAMRLQGGAPNPVWASGKARINYSILGGLFEGRHTFYAEVGEKCTAMGGDPLAGIEFIQDITPKGRASVYSRPQAAYALNMNRILEIPYQNDESFSRPPRRIKPVVHKFECKDSRGNLIDGSTSLSRDGYVSTMTPTNILKGNENHVITVEVKAKELFSNGSERFMRDNGRDWSERKTQTFRTKEAPPVLMTENFQACYPLQKQNYFLKGETYQNKGFIKLAQGRPDLLSGGSTSIGVIGQGRINYYARFFEENGGDTIRVPLQITDNHRQLWFNVSQLENDKLYGLQIVKENPRGLDDLVSSSAGSIGLPGGIDNPLLGFQLTALNVNVNESTVTSQEIKQVILPDNALNNREEILHTYYFHTSKYNLFSEKVDDPTSEEYQTYGVFDFFKITQENGESYEFSDGNEYTCTEGDFVAQTTFDQMVEFDIQERSSSAEFQTNYFPGSTRNSYINNRVDRYVWLNRSRMSNLSGALRPVHSGIAMSFNRFRQNQTFDYDSAVNFSNDSYFKPRLSDNSINSAFTFVVNRSQGSIGAGNGSPFSMIGGGSNTGKRGRNTSRNTSSTFGFTPGFLTAPLNVKAKITYSPSLLGWSALNNFQANVLSFLNQNLRFSIFGNYGTMRKYLSENDRSNLLVCNRFLAYDASRLMKLNRGTHSFIMYYRYPHVNGGTKRGSGKEVKWVY